MRVPKELRNHPSYESKDFIYKSLGTDSLSQAIRLRDHELARVISLLNNEEVIPLATKETAQTPPSSSQTKTTLLEAMNISLKANQNKVTKATLNGYQNAVKRLLKTIKKDNEVLSHISVNMVNKHIGELRKDVTEKTINNHLNYLSTVFKVAKRNGMTTGENPFTNFGLSNSPTNARQPYSRSQALAIYQMLPTRFKIAWKILYYTGMRRSELFKLNAESIVELEAENGLISCFSIAPNGEGKTINATRYIPVHPDLKDDIEGFNGFDYSPNTFGSYRKKTVENLYGKQFAKTHDTHSLRHTFSTTLHNHFPEQPQLVDWLTGHSRTIRSESFQTYFHGYGLDRLHKAIKAIPKMKV